MHFNFGNSCCVTPLLSSSLKFMDFLGATGKKTTEAVQASFSLNYCFCGNQDFAYVYYHLKHVPVTFFLFNHKLSQSVSTI